MSTTLLHRDFKAHWKLLLIFFAVMTMYLLVIISMYDPQNADLLAQFAGLKFPEEILSAFGFTVTDPSLAGFLSSYLYGVLLPALCMVYAGLVANALVAGLVDKGTMASVLMGPITRKNAVITQAVYLTASLFVLIGLTAFMGMVSAQINFPGLLDTSAYLKINTGLFLLSFALGGISFFFSCLFNQTGISLAFGLGIPAVFLLVRMLHNASPKAEVLRYATLFSLYDPLSLAGGQPQALQLLALGVLAIILLVVGVLVFDRKDLSL